MLTTSLKTFFGSTKPLARLARMVTLFVVLSTSVLMIFENNFIFYPDKQSRYEPDLGFPVQYCEFMTRDGVKLHGAYAPLPDARGTILWCHGNSGNLTYGFDVAREFHKLGMSVLLFDYRGYGKSEGRPNGEGILLDAEAAYNYLTKEIKEPGSRVVILGESLGGAPAIKLASEFECAGLIIQSTFTSIRDMAGVVFPYLPWVRFFVRTNLPNLETIRKVKAPKLLIHSHGDQTVPFWMGQRLFEAAPDPKEFLELGSEGHNDTFGAVVYYDRVTAFLDRVLPNP